MKKCLLLMVLCLSLQGCFFVAGAAAGAAAVAVVYDHRKIEKILLDEHIAKLASDRIHADPEITNSSHVEVNCFNQMVLLTGETTSVEMRTRIEEIVRGIAKIKRIYNQITVTGRASALTQANDSWITTKIKSQMIATKGLQSSNIKVVTEKGTVYLLGIVSHSQADIAVSIARQVSGVQRVIKIFQYTH